MKSLVLMFLASLTVVSPAHAGKKKQPEVKREICDEFASVNERIDCLHKVVESLKVKTMVFLFATENDDTEIQLDELTPAELAGYEKEVRRILKEQLAFQETMDAVAMSSQTMPIVIFRNQLLVATK